MYDFSTRRSLEKNQVRRIVRATGMTGAVVVHDERGFYISSYDSVHPLFEALSDITVAPRVVDQPAPRPPVNRANSSGITSQIYAWVLANPQASKTDAVAHFSHANPTTVGVQFGKARRAVV